MVVLILVYIRYTYKVPNLNYYIAGLSLYLLHLYIFKDKN